MVLFVPVSRDVLCVAAGSSTLLSLGTMPPKRGAGGDGAGGDAAAAAGGGALFCFILVHRGCWGGELAQLVCWL